MAKQVRYPHRLQLRFSDVHLEALERAEREHRVRPHDFIRAAILNQRITASPPPPPMINMEAARFLSKMSVNVNQISRRWNQYPLEGITRKEIDDIQCGLAFIAGQLLGYTTNLDRIVQAGFARILEAGTPPP